MPEPPPTGAVGTRPAQQTAALSRRDRVTRPRIRVGAKGLIVERGQVLLVRERRPDGSTFWTLPGGGIERHESLVGSLRRELREEIGSEVDVHGLETACRYRHETSPDTVTVYGLFGCDLRSTPEPDPMDGIMGHGWFPPGALPRATLSPFAETVRELLGAEGGHVQATE